MQCVLTFKNVETCCIEWAVLSCVDHIYDDDNDDNSALFILHVFCSISLSMWLKFMHNFINTTDNIFESL